MSVFSSGMQTADSLQSAPKQSFQSLDRLIIIFWDTGSAVPILARAGIIIPMPNAQCPMPNAQCPRL